MEQEGGAAKKEKNVSTNDTFTANSVITHCPNAKKYIELMFGDILIYFI